MRKLVVVAVGVLAVSACAQPQSTFVPSSKSALALRSIQSRTVDMPADAAMRSVVATLHDLGYRITRVAPEAGTVSGTRQAALRMAVVVQPRDADRSTVRANASIAAALTETQVDSAEFYQRNFFEPLAATSGRVLAVLDDAETAPEAVRPVAEINTAREREAQARAAGRNGE
jgi:hypothetical protein